MRKCDELALPDSCLNKAKNDEFIFVLLERDDATPDTIRYWVKQRLKRKLNAKTDKKIITALRVAEEMEKSKRDGNPTKYEP